MWRIFCVGRDATNLFHRVYKENFTFFYGSLAVGSKACNYTGIIDSSSLLLMGSPNPPLSREHHCHKQLNRSKNRVITYDIGKNHQDPKKDLMNREILIDCHKNIYDDCIYYFNYLLKVLSRTNKALIVFSWSK